MEREELGRHMWYGSRGGYFMLDVTENIEPLEPTVVDGQLLLPKAEYHCSLVALRRIVKDDDVVQRLYSDVRDFVSAHDIEYQGLVGDKYICRKDGEITIVQEAGILGLAGLRSYLQRKVPTYDPAFPHVTLLKSENSRYGIAINTAYEFERYCTKL